MAKKKPPAQTLTNSLPIGSYWRGLEITHQQLDEAVGKLIEWRYGLSAGIVLAGNTGSGKTSLCHIACNWTARWGRRAEMMGEPDLLDDIREGYSRKDERLVRRLSMADVLILDDVGAGHYGDQDWYESIMWRLLDKRTEAGRKTIITTNLNPDDFKRRIGQRARSRVPEIVEPGFYVLMFDVPDYRLNKWQLAKAA